MEKTVLLVEDSQDEIMLARRAFAKAGLAEVLRVTDGNASLPVQVGECHPSLVLLDLQMPGKDGVAILRELRASPVGTSLPLVVLSSSDEAADIAAAYAAGANSYLRKPVDFDQFVQLIRDIDRYWLGHNMLPVERGRA